MRKSLGKWPAIEVRAVADEELPKAELQKGIYFRSKESPPPFFTLMLLGPASARNGDARPDPDAGTVHDLLERLWQLWGDLEAGKIHSLPGVTVPHGYLDTLLGFGLPAFSLAGAIEEAPAALREHRFAKPTAAGGTLVAGGGDGTLESGINYAAGVDRRLSDAHFAVQFTARTPLAVERAIVETWRFLIDPSPERGGPEPALEILGVFTGSQRDDRRSWIDFHDGLNNLPSHKREAVITIGMSDDGQEGLEEWTLRGTYLAFIRLRIHLEVWQGLNEGVRQRLVGRDKLNGCPLRFNEDPDGEPVERLLGRRGPPHDAGSAVDGDWIAGMTHIRRANSHPGLPSSAPESHRIFRQGYPFFEPDLDAPGRFQVGLNFVSFQETPRRLTEMLNLTGWLGGTNFGGRDDVRAAVGDPRVDLLTAYASGMFFVPPLVRGEPFPGARALRAEAPAPPVPAPAPGPG
jgi:deferrochelatase/peroxidase EfeB